MNKINYNEIWEEIFNILKTKPIELLNYETMNTDSFKFQFGMRPIHHIMELKHLQKLSKIDYLSRATEQNRTADIQITNLALYQLSYGGKMIYNKL